MKKLFFLLIILAGCSDPRPIKHYTIKIVGPNQERKWNITSYSRPIIVTHFGGQLSLKSNDGILHWWEREIVAPTGWNLIIEEQK